VNRLEMSKTVVLAFILIVLTLVSISLKPARSQATLQTIFIQQDGTIYPDSLPIQRSGNTYTLTGNINAAIKILKGNIVLDGAGHTLSGQFSGNSTDIWVIGTGPDKNTLDKYTIGVDLGNSSVQGVVIKNLNVENFSIGMYIWTKNDTVSDNDLSQNIVGMLVSGSNMTIIRNYISTNLRGLFFGFNTGQTPNDIIVSQNNFEKNAVQLSGCACKVYNTSEPPHNWDNGKIGNYWSNYNGTDANHDGIGDSPYLIDPVDYDRFPLMQSSLKPLVPAAKIPAEETAIGVSAAAVFVAAVFVISLRRKRKTS